MADDKNTTQPGITIRMVEWEVRDLPPKEVHEAALARLSKEELCRRLLVHEREDRAEANRWAEASRIPPLPFTVEVRVRNDHGRLVVTGLKLGAKPPEGGELNEEREITQRGLREVSLRTILDMLATDMTFEGLHEEKPIKRKPQRRPGPKGYEAEHFKEQRLDVLYRRALRDLPSRPTKRIAEWLYISEPTARRWVKRAKALGVIKTENEPAENERRYQA